MDSYQLLYAFVCLIGAVKAIGIALRMICILARHGFRDDDVNLQFRYGPGSWAVVTGASDGIGAQYCRWLALKGFNIVLVSRTLSKLQTVEAELKFINETIDTKIIQVDFTGNSTRSMQYYQDKVVAEIKKAKLDVSMVVLNAGVMHLGFMDRGQEEMELQDTLDCNIYHIVSLLKKLLPGLISRKYRSGLVVVSSIAGYAPIPGCIAYAASKAFLNHLLYAVGNEVSSKHWNKVDILTSTPGVVKTKLSEKANLPNFLAPYIMTSPQASVQSTLRDMQYESTTAGPLLHECQEIALQAGFWLVPQRIMLYFADLLTNKASEDS